MIQDSGAIGYGDVTITPTAASQVLPASVYNHDTTIAGDANLVGGNIVTGKTIFSVAGSYPRRYHGTLVPTSIGGGNYSFALSGLPFQPTIVQIGGFFGSTNAMYFDTSVNTTLIHVGANMSNCTFVFNSTGFTLTTTSGNETFDAASYGYTFTALES